MPCFSFEHDPENIGLTDEHFTAEIVAGSGTLSYFGGGAVGWQVDPKPTPDTTTVRFTPISPISVTHILTNNYTAGNLSSCDGVSLAIHFVGGTPSPLTLDEGDTYDDEIVGTLAYIEATYQSTESSGAPWYIDTGLVEITGEVTAEECKPFWTNRILTRETNRG